MNLTVPFFPVPVPGGCNQVFDLEIDPNIRLTSTEYHTQVWFQWANVGGRPGDPPRSCEQKSLINRLSYDVYVGYVLENDDRVSALFEVVQSMMTAEQVQSSAQKVSQFFGDFFLSQAQNWRYFYEFSVFSYFHWFTLVIYLKKAGGKKEDKEWTVFSEIFPDLIMIWETDASILCPQCMHYINLKKLLISKF